MLNSKLTLKGGGIQLYVEMIAQVQFISWKVTVTPELMISILAMRKKLIFMGSNIEYYNFAYLNMTLHTKPQGEK